jgi:hypothetical protein
MVIIIILSPSPCDPTLNVFRIVDFSHRAIANDEKDENKNMLTQIMTIIFFILNHLFLLYIAYINI